MRKLVWLSAALSVFLFPGTATAGVKVTLTPDQATVGLGGTQEFVAVVTGTSDKGVKFAVCDGDGKNCVVGGNAAVGTIVEIGTDANNNRIGQYTAPAANLAPPACTQDGAGCRVKIRAKLRARAFRKKKAFATAKIASPGVLERSSVASDGSQAATDSSWGPSVSADGRFVAFASDATDLVDDDTNDLGDIFVRDTCLGAAVGCSPSTTRVSLANNGDQATGGASEEPAISADGRFVAFYSSASNLLGVGVDTNGLLDVFVRDTCFGAPNSCVPSTTRVSVADDGSEATGGVSAFPAISADGRFIAFDSSATNLVANDTNDLRDIFVRDTCRGAGDGCVESTIRVSLADDESEGDGFSLVPAISADGRFVAFSSLATNLIGVGNDTNGTFDGFVRDTLAGTTTQVSVADDESQATGGASVADALSADGRFVVFESSATNLLGPGGDTNFSTDIFVRDTVAATTVRVSVADDGSEANNGSVDPAISADGRFVAFLSFATNLVTGDTNGFDDIFVRDTCFGAPGPCTPSTQRVSLAADGSQATDGDCQDPALSADGRFVAFRSDATDLVTGDTNGFDDIFVARTGAVRRSLAYVTNTADDSVSVIDTGTNTVIATVPVGNGPVGVALTPNGLRAYVTSLASNEVSVINTLSHTVVATVTGFDLPGDIVVTPDGSRAYVLTGDGGEPAGHLVPIDTDTNTIGVPIEVGFMPVGMAITPDGSRAYTTAIGPLSVVDTDPASGTFHTVIDSIVLGDRPLHLAFTPDGRRAYVANNFSQDISVLNTDPASSNFHSVVTTIELDGAPFDVAINPLRPRAYVALGDIALLNTNKNKVIGSIALADDAGALAVTPEGPYLYAAVPFSDSVSVIDTVRNIVLTSIPVGQSPSGIAIHVVR